MASPARRHRERTTAASRTAAGPATRADATQYELMLAKLAEDRRRLHAAQSIERRAEIKRLLLPEYGPWIAGVLDGDHGIQDDVFMTVLVWLIDVGDFPAALQLAAYALRHKLTLPDQYKRTLGCLLAEEFAEMALRAQVAQAPMDTESLITLSELVALEDMPDEVRAKLHKAIGYAMIQGKPGEQEQNSALVHLRRALQLHDKCGVKRDIELIERAMRKAQEPPKAEQPPLEAQQSKPKAAKKPPKAKQDSAGTAG